MAELCAIEKDKLIDIIRNEVSSSGTIAALEDEIVFDLFVKKVTELTPNGVTTAQLIDVLNTTLGRFLRKHEDFANKIPSIVESNWRSSPHVSDNAEILKNSINPDNVAAEPELKIYTKDFGIQNFYINYKYISEFETLFSGLVNENIFVSNGKLVKTDQDLNRAIKEVKLSLAADIAAYLSSRDPSIKSYLIYNDDGKFNKDIYDKLITSALKFIKLENRGKDSTYNAREIFNKMIMLKYFDSSIDSFMSDTLHYSKGFKNSHNEPKNGVKYSFDNKTNIVKRYEEDMADIYDHTNKSLKSYIESISYKDGYGRKKYINMNMFNSIILEIMKSKPSDAVELRSNTEEAFIKLLQSTSNAETTSLNGKTHMIDPLIGIRNKISELFNASKLENNMKLFSMIASYVKDLTPINYIQSEYNSTSGRYTTTNLDLGSSKVKYDLEKSLQLNSKWTVVPFLDKVTFDLENSKIILKTDIATYILPLNGERITIKSKSEGIVFHLNSTFQWVEGNKDTLFLDMITLTFGEDIINEDVINSIKTSVDSDSFFNLMANVLLNNYFSRKLELENSGDDKVSNLDFFEKSDTNLDVRSIVFMTKGDEKTKKLKQVYSSTIGALRVAGFNEGDKGLNILYNAYSIANGDSYKSFVKNKLGSNLPLNRMTNLIAADLVLFADLVHNNSQTLKYNLFNPDAGINIRTSLKTTFTNKNGDTIDIKNLSARDLMYDQIVLNYFANRNIMNVLAVTYSDKTLIWMKTVDMLKPIVFAKYEENKAIKEIKDILDSKGILTAEYKTFSAAMNDFVSYFNSGRLGENLSIDSRYYIIDRGKISINKEFAKSIEPLKLNNLKTAEVEDISNLHYETMHGMFNVLESNLVRDLKIILDLIPEINHYSANTYDSLFDVIEKNKITQDQLYKAIRSAFKKGIEVTISPEIHYNLSDGILTRNETLSDNIKRYNNKDYFDDNIKTEKKLFGYLLAKNNFEIESKFANFSDNDVILDNLLDKTLMYKNEWIDPKSHTLILYKVKHHNNYIEKFSNGKDITDATELEKIAFDENYTIVLNPELDRFFEVNNLIGNNYTAITVGMPFIHPGKTNIAKELKKASKLGIPEDLRMQFAIKSLEAARTSAHSKRMVINGATIHAYILNKFDGVPEFHKIAVVDDPITYVFNLQGITAKQKHYDGGAWANPFVAIWEANSLPELEMSSVHRKSIGFFPNSEYLASGLAKWATFSFNNEMIRNASSRNGVVNSGHDFMKKMTDHKWIIPNLDITNGGLNTFSGYYYMDEATLRYIKINSIKKLPIVIDSNGNIDNKYLIDASYVNRRGEPGEGKVILPPVSINSNYDLWKVLGGEFSMSFSNEGFGKTLKFKEASIEAVAKVASEVAIERTEDSYKEALQEIFDKNEELGNIYLRKLLDLFKPESERATLKSLKYYLQPMKHSDIHYIAPASSIKNGAGNINPVSAYNKEGFELNTWKVPSKYLGIQLNADHHVDNSEVSEMSLVISACEENGTTHHLAHMMYESIGQSIYNNLKELENLTLVNNTKSQELIYYILGKALCKSFIEESKWEDISLAKSYMRIINKELGENFEAYQLIGSRKFKLSFDDPNVFGAFYNLFASQKNAEAIKRKYAGAGMILCPSQDFNTLYDFEGKVVKYTDLLEEFADNPYIKLENGELIRNSEYSEMLKLNPSLNGLKLSPREFMQEFDKHVDVSEVEVGDFVEIGGKPVMVLGYDIKYNPLGELKIGLKQIRENKLQQPTIKKLVSQGRNLKTSNHKFTVDSTNIINGISNFDIWDLDSVKLSHGLKELFSWSDVNKTTGQLYLNPNKNSKETFPTAKMEELMLIYNESRDRILEKFGNQKLTGDIKNDRKYINDLIQDDLDLADGIENINNSGSNRTNPKLRIPIKYRLNGEKLAELKENGHKYTPYGIMIGRTQAHAFGLKPGDSVQEILHRKEEFFEDRFRANIGTQVEDYDLYLAHHSGNHLHIMQNNSENLNIIAKLLANGKVTELNILQRDGYRIIDNTQAYKVLDSQKWYQYTTENGDIFDLVMVDTAGEVRDFINSHMFDAVCHHPSEVNDSKSLLQSVIGGQLEGGLTIRERFGLSVDAINPMGSTELLNLAKTILSNISEKSTKALDLYSNQYYKKYIRNNDNSIMFDKEIAKENAKKRYNSFLQYLDFTVARIPAQSMQSFMNMRIEGFVETNTNIALVNAIQFWLQGSDLDIDKAFILGATISKDGYYVGWSDIFNYEAIDASNELPIPNGKRYIFDLNGINITEDIYGKLIDLSTLSGININNYKQEFASDPKKLETLAKYLTQLLNLDKVLINLPNPELIDVINKHTLTQLDTETLNNGLKNKIWYLAKSTSGNIRNFYALMNPISIDDITDIANESSNGRDGNYISLLNPASIMILQLQNSVGKDCIGISATGSKVAASIINYYNLIIKEVLNRNVSSSDLTIKGNTSDSSGRAYNIVIDGKDSLLESGKTISNINWKNNPRVINNPEIKAIFESEFAKGVPEDILTEISSLITLATDNAKELILEKINATKDLMSIYVYNILLGEDISKVAKYMTQPEISMVLRKAAKNLTSEFGQQMNISKAISYYLDGVDLEMFNLQDILGGVDKVFSDLLLTNKAFATKALEIAKNITQNSNLTYDDLSKKVKFDQLISGKVIDEETLRLLSEFIDLFIQSINSEKTLIEKVRRKDYKKRSYIDFDEDSYFNDENFNNNEENDLDLYLYDLDEYNNMLRTSKVDPFILVRYLKESKRRLNDLSNLSNNLKLVYLNISTLKDLKSDSSVLTTFGLLLSLNQGIPTKQVDRINKIDSIESSINRFLNKVSDPEVPYFTLNEFFRGSEDYKNKVTNAFSKSGAPFNILDIIRKSPHFSLMWKGFMTVQNASNNVSIKSQYTEKFVRQLKSKGLINGKIQQRDVSKVNSYINDRIINKFLSRSFNDKFINTPKDITEVYDESEKLVLAGSLELPYLDFSLSNNRLTFKRWFELKYIPKLKSENPDNLFVQGLKFSFIVNDVGNSVVILRLPVSMNGTRESDKMLINSYIDGFNEIKDKTSGIGNENYTYTNEELFFLYNLLTNKNSFGESSLTKIFDASLREYEANPKKENNIIVDFFNFERGMIDDPNIKFLEYNDINFETLELLFSTYGQKEGVPYYLYDGDKKVYYNSKGEQITLSNDTLISLLDNGKRGYNTVKNMSNTLRKLLLSNLAEIKFVEC